jgi:hypothetical protein
MVGSGKEGGVWGKENNSSTSWMSELMDKDIAVPCETVELSVPYPPPARLSFSGKVSHQPWEGVPDP